MLGITWCAFRLLLSEKNVNTAGGIKTSKILSFAALSVLGAMSTLVCLIFALEKSSPLRESTSVAPDFPWPPPKPSSRWSIRQDHISDRNSLKTLGDYDRLLSKSLAAAEYSELSYFRVPDGFALVTRIECIDDGGCPLPGVARWKLDQPVMQRFSILDIRLLLASLLKAEAGRFRVLVFIVTDVPFSGDRAEPTYGQAGEWLRRGLNVLPPSIASQLTNPGFVLSVLTYEFTKSVADGQVQAVDRTNLEISQQLKCSGVNLRSSHEKIQTEANQDLVCWRGSYIFPACRSNTVRPVWEFERRSVRMVPA